MRHPSYRPSRFLLVPILAAQLASLAVAGSIPGKFYEYYTVADTSLGQFTSLGQGPAINNHGLVAFTGYTSIGQTIWIGDGNNHPAVDINPAYGNPTPGRELYGNQVQINDNKQVVAQDSTNSTPIASQARIWYGSTTNTYKYITRGGQGHPFDDVLGYPAINKNGDAVAVVIKGVQKSLYLLESNGTATQFAISGSLPQPAIADNGSVVLTNYDSSNRPILTTFQQPGLTDQQTVADFNNFTSIDSAPGISANGAVIAFQGNLNAAGATAYSTTSGPGVFFAFSTGASWVIQRVTGGMVCSPTCVNSAELGYNDANAPIYFSSYASDTRVAATDMDMGGGGLGDDSIEISFVATPNSASRTNPWLSSTPLLFSAQTGLWTIRVDFESQLGVLNPITTPHQTSAIPVVQIGDRLGSAIVSSIGVNAQVGLAAVDETGANRTMRRGDHRVAFWVSTTAGNQMIIRANHLDSDQDGLLDHWETTGIDMNQDGIVDLNLAAMGANPNKRDIFLQLDWLVQQQAMNFQPAPSVISPVPGSGLTMGLVPAVFAAAPALSGTLYGIRADGTTPADIPAGITLHVDGGRGADTLGGPFSVNMGAGPLAGGNQVGMPGDPNALVHALYFGADGSVNLPGANARSFANVKQNYLGSQDYDARELAFRYAVLGFTQGFQDTTPAIHRISSATPTTFVPTDGIVPGLAKFATVYVLSGTDAGDINQVSSISGNTITVGRPFTTTLDTSSQVLYLQGYTGLAEVSFLGSPDNNSLPGNDLQLDGASIYAFSPRQVPCYQWRTLTHELGHTLGLRHGGINFQPDDNPNYLSLMSYAYQLQCVSTVNSYGSLAATATLPGFDDFDSLRLDFADDMFFLGSTQIGTPTYAGHGDSFQAETQTIQDYINFNGPIDGVAPTVQVTSPLAGSSVGLTGTLSISLTAADNVAVSSVRVSFDVNGDGVIGTGESQTATNAGSGVYRAQFKNIAGSPGTRAITAVAFDSSGNPGKTALNVSVVNPTPAPTLASLQPPSVTHGAATFYLVINGSGFVNGCTGNWKGQPRKTVFVSASQIKMAVLNTDVAAAGTAQVTATNPAQGSTGSNALTFRIN